MGRHNGKMKDGCVDSESLSCSVFLNMVLLLIYQCYLWSQIGLVNHPRFEVKDAHLEGVQCWGYHQFNLAQVGVQANPITCLQMVK